MRENFEPSREANRLMLAELEKGDTWTWSWRPATVWLVGFFWLWSLVLAPLVNAAIGAAIPIFSLELATLTAVYMGLYLDFQGHRIRVAWHVARLFPGMRRAQGRRRWHWIACTPFRASRFATEALRTVSQDDSAAAGRRWLGHPAHARP
jgi:hypothetical protein